MANRLVELIQSAQTSIYVASGHLRSRPVSEALLAAKQANPDLDIKIYLDGQEFIAESTAAIQERDLQSCLDRAGTSISKQEDCMDRGFYFSYAMQEAGIPLKFKYYSYRWHYSYAAQMHHKYIIVDGKTVAMGSYNLSDNAEHNTMENVAIIDGSGYQNIVDQYVANFDSMWNTGEGLYEPLMDRIQNGTGSVPIVFDSMALTC
ncbi:MAG: phospholipase D-like domain-containing protein [bacterium]